MIFSFSIFVIVFTFILMLISFLHKYALVLVGINEKDKSTVFEFDDFNAVNDGEKFFSVVNNYFLVYLLLHLFLLSHE